MGRVKETIFDNDDWVEEEQEKVVNDINRWDSITYADLLDNNHREFGDVMEITTIDGNVHRCENKHLMEVKGLQVSYYTDTNFDTIVQIPLNKIVLIKYYHKGKK